MLLSVAIIARNEETHIGACLESIAGVADEIVVLLDESSHDRTDVIAQAYGARVYVDRWRGFAGHRNLALDVCRGEWVLFLDADERITPDLRREVAELKQTWHTQPDGDDTPTDAHIAGYGIPRYNIFFGKVVQGGGWYPDYQLRLLRRTRARYNENQHVHEVATVAGKTATLKGHLLHINIERLSEFWSKQTRYALAEARTLYGEQRAMRWRNFAGSPTREFWRRYIRLGGWRDGLIGLFLCASLAWFEVVKFGCLRLLYADTPSSKAP
jgi:glycosyltransferase involved in cell wall biosynthesis